MARGLATVCCAVIEAVMVSFDHSDDAVRFAVIEF